MVIVVADVGGWGALQLHNLALSPDGRLYGKVPKGKLAFGPAGNCLLDMLGMFAEFETNLRRERQLEGIARAKAEDVYKGRHASIDAAQVRAMKAGNALLETL